MSDELKPQGDDAGEITQAPDPTSELKKMIESLNQSVTNLKAEMNRKLDAARTPAPQPSVKDDKTIAELMYENPEAAVSQLTSTVTQHVTGIFEKREKTREAVNKIYSDYPELENPAHPLSQAAQEKFLSLSESDRQDPRALRAAVLEAAVEMGLPPKAKRKSNVPTENDDFSLGGNTGKAPKRGQKREDLSDNVLQTAEMMGLDVNDPKVVERLKSRSKRSYGKYGE